MTDPIVWSIAGTDSAGGAGLAADQRAADAFGIHLCPVVAAVTAQNSREVTRLQPLDAQLLGAQLAALEDDMPPRVIKTGLLGGVEQVQTVARWVDSLRERSPLALVVDPVLAASTGASFADAATLAAYRELLLPRATLVTPNRREATLLVGDAQGGDVPGMARALRRIGAAAVCITGGDSGDIEGRVLDWIDTDQAAGWLASPRIATENNHGTGCTFASSAAAALACGFVPADALVLAKMSTSHALGQGRRAGSGAGPVYARPGFGRDPALLPMLSFGEDPSFFIRGDAPRPGLGLYAIVDSATRVEQVLEAGVRTVQLRIKSGGRAQWCDEIARSAAACRRSGARFFVNDHWQLALELRAQGVHLGQEDLQAIGEDGRSMLVDSGIELGISSHSLWELCRARGLAPTYIACGPVWPTSTKAMPWRPQGLHNLAWWCAMAGVPVAAIGGILSAEQAEEAARCGADAVCAVRVLGDEPRHGIVALQAALARGRTGVAVSAPDLPSPSL